MRERGSGTRLTFDQGFRHHLSQLNVRLELEHTEAIKRAVESGLGISCISRLALRDAFRRGSLVAIETPQLDLAASIQLHLEQTEVPDRGHAWSLSNCARQLYRRDVTRSDQISAADHGLSRLSAKQYADPRPRRSG